jgi:bifunctional non-homologous end joining protein LigD
MAAERSAVLFYKGGTSNKTYQVQIEPTDDGQFEVKFQYGRTGSTLQTGSKTAKPVSLAEAEKIFTGLITEKTGKGYKLAGIMQAAKSYQTKAAAKTASGILPQLLNPIDEALAEKLIADDDWFMQEKADGHHQMARVQSRNVIGSNRKGEVIAVSTRIESGLADILGGYAGSSVVDFEAVGDTAMVFDLLQLGDEDLRHLGAWERWQRLFPLLKGSKSVISVRTAVGTDAKRRLYNQIKAERGEGVVFKRKDAAYTAGRPNSGGPFLKLKFVAMATCVVLGQNGSKSSVILGVLDGGKPVYIGKCTIPPNHTMPVKGDLVEVRYLYAYKGGSMVQAVYLGKRDDKDTPDTRESLKLKASGDDPKPTQEEKQAECFDPAPQRKAKKPAKAELPPKKPVRVEKQAEVPAPATPKSNVISIDRSAAAKKAWDTIRANRAAAKKAGQS